MYPSTHAGETTREAFPSLVVGEDRRGEEGRDARAHTHTHTHTHTTRTHLSRADAAAGAHVPEAARAVDGAGHAQVAGVVELRGGHLAAVAGERVDAAARAHVPHLGVVIERARDDLIACRVEAQAHDLRRVTLPCATAPNPPPPPSAASGETQETKTHRAVTRAKLPCSAAAHAPRGNGGNSGFAVTPSCARAHQHVYTHTHRVSLTKVVQCLPDARRAGALTEEPTVRPKRQHALGHPAPPPAHSTDTSVTGGTHFAFVCQSVLLHAGRPKEGAHEWCVLIFDVSHTQYTHSTHTVHDAQRTCGKCADRVPGAASPVVRVHTQRLWQPHASSHRSQPS